MFGLLSAVGQKHETTKKIRRSLGFSEVNEKKRHVDNSAYTGEVKV